MKRMCLIAALLAALLLTGCGRKTQTGSAAQQTTNQTTNQTTTTTQTAGDRNPTAAELGRAETMDLEFMVEGLAETMPATLYIGQGYSLYIPNEGWGLKKGADDGIPEETWESIMNDDVEFKVSHYSSVTPAEARQMFVAHEDYVFEDLMGGEFGDPLTGIDEDGDHLRFMSVEGNGTVYILFWEYPKGTEEGFGARMEQILGTFQVTG